MDVDGALAHHHVAAAGLGEQRVARDDAPGAAHQRDQDVELEPGELDRLALHGDLPRADVDLHVAHRQLLAHRLRARAAQHRAQPGQQLARAEGLGHVVVGAELEADHAVGLVALGGEHEDGDAALVADAPAAPRGRPCPGIITSSSTASKAPASSAWRPLGPS